MAALAATLDMPEHDFRDQAAVPPLWHWLYFLETSPQSLLALDGHAEKGGFLPPISLPRRMWAGSRIEFLQPLRVGQLAERASTIRAITLKRGRSGGLAFVTVEHIIRGRCGDAIKELHDIVYRERSRPDTPAPTPALAPASSHFSTTLQADPVLLFRYSALTFNSHRIHYDRDFARTEEGYPGLVVHGPLLATMMLRLLTSSLPGMTVCSFEFKALHPVFEQAPFTVCCNKPDSAGVAGVWVQDNAGVLCMLGSATVAANTVAVNRET